MRTGVCVMEGFGLADWQVHTYRHAWSEYKLRLILNRYRRYILRYGATAVIVKIPPRHKQTRAVLQLMRRIEQLARRHGCDFDLTTKDELKHRTGTRSTAEMIGHVKRLYPELGHLSEGSNGDYNDHRKLFEAVMSAHLYSRWAQERELRTTE